ncbi:MAG TPA: TIGR01777 family oxidoreductase, partial [Pyrinomonadaceae bacterium]|nr:TIGR01777 family oxidoreductase [Pyrinomonadaceae bacterium]
GHDAAVHLAGEPIAAGRWTDAKKQRIRESRTLSTRLLAETLARLQTQPRVLVCASAIGYYGDRGAEVLTEASAPGQDFLSDVCREWEAAAEPARAAGLRTVHLRFGVVLSKEGGALAQMLTPFQLGIGGQIGNGRHYMSWLALDDAVGMIEYALADEKLAGAVNAVAPQPVTNSEFAKTLGRVLGRPTLLPMPAFALRLALGEMAKALLLSSARVEPARLQAAGYQFKYPQLEGALRHVLHK